MCISACVVQLINELSARLPGRSLDDCRQALVTNNWNVKSALSYLCVQELLSLDIAGVNAVLCLRALEKSDWKVDRAAEWLLQLQGES